MPHYGIIGVVWLLLVLAAGYWGNRRKLDPAFIKGVQALVTLAAVAAAAPDLGAFRTVLAVFWLLLYLALTKLLRHFRAPPYAARIAGAAAIGVAFLGTDSLNVMLIRTLIMLALTSIFLLGLNLGFRFLIRRILWIFPVLFAVPRTVGWLAQWEEMLNDPEQRIARPRQVYVGKDERDYVPLHERG